MSGVRVKNWFKIQKKAAASPYNVERQLPWVLGVVTLFSDSVT